ncbi:MAG: iron ABC transporter permease [Chloroflexi bacterium]|nr:iron ABC transporter permease [Chloroflexota bacterium]
MSSRWLRALTLNIVLLILAAGLSVAVGAVTIPLKDLGRLLWHAVRGLPAPQDVPSYYATIVFDLRLPHAALVLLAGSALGSSGAAYQGVFRNPLADPYLLGVASGAGLGAVVALSLAWPQTQGGMFGLPAAAFLGAVVTVALVYALARVDGTVPATTLILAGVAVGALATALTSFLMLQSEGTLRRAMTYLMGGAPLGGWAPVLAMLPYWLVGQAVLLASGHALNVLQFGEEQAQQLGLHAQRAKTVILAAASLTTAAAVAFAGIIGFIGLVVPHIVRLLWGEDYRWEIPLSLLGGGTALLLSDLLARTLLAPQTLPVGIVTALFGAPFFLWVLQRTKRQAA